MIEQSTLDFFKELRINNYRAWYHANKSRYETARNNAWETAEEILQGLHRFDPSVGFPDLRKCTFRIARDTRFSPDKTPYKTHIGILFNPEENTHCRRSSIYYLHIEPGDSFVSCGVYMPDKEYLKAIRTAIDNQWEDFSAILNERSFRKTVGDLAREDKLLKRVPAGFDKNSPAAEYLKLNHFYTYVSFTDAEICSPRFVEEALKAFRCMKPLNDFLNRAIRDYRMQQAEF